MPKFRKKPVVIDAVQFTGNNLSECLQFIGISKDSADGCGVMGLPLFIPTLEGDMRADVGDWIIRGVKGEFYPCKPDIFSLTYDLVTPVVGAA